MENGFNLLTKKQRLQLIDLATSLGMTIDEYLLAVLDLD